MDTNEFIFALYAKQNVQAKIIEVIGKKFECFIPHIIAEEVNAYLKRNEGKESASKWKYYLQKSQAKIIFENRIVLELTKKYEKFGLKENDAKIAAITEFVKAQYLVSENRHFLKETNIKEFRIINAKEFAKILKETE